MIHDDYKRVLLVAGGIVGVPIAAFLVYVGLVFGFYLGLLLVILATLGAIGGVALLGAKVYWAFKGPHAIYEKDVQPVRALVDHQGGVTVLPFAPYPLGLQTMHYHQDSHSRQDGLLPAPVPALELPPALPSAKSIHELVPVLAGARGRILLGYDTDGPCWLDVADLLSVAMAGNSGRGKSNALLWVTLQLLKQEVETYILDGKGDLRRWLGQHHEVAYLPGEIQQTVSCVLAEAEWRLAESSAHPSATFEPLLVVIDELDLVAGRCELVTRLIELLTKKTRSVNMHGLYSNQSLPAELVGGVQNRGVIVSRICFYCDDEAARMIGVRKDNGGQALLQQLAPPAPKGLAVARTAVFGWRILSFPEVPVSAVGWLLGDSGHMPVLPPLPMKPGFAQQPPPPLSQGKVLQMPQRQAAPEERERERVLEEWRKQPDASASALCSLAGISNNKTAKVRHYITEELERLAAQEVDA